MSGNILTPKYAGALDFALTAIAAKLKGDYPVSSRTIGLLLLQDDQEIRAMVRENDRQCYDVLEDIVLATKAELQGSSGMAIALKRNQTVAAICDEAVTAAPPKSGGIRETLSRLMMHPATGYPILLIILYFGIYQFVGVFGAGTLVDLLDGFFERQINPWLIQTMGFIPWHSLQDLLVGEYGVFTLGLRYSFAIILPIVGTFFLAFSVIEDTGYLPRLTMLIDRGFKFIGLNGRAVIPMVLGLGCATMATIVTRTLETRRERVIATLLLALAIPCSAQLGVILAILSGYPMAIPIWGLSVGLIFLVVGFLTSRFLAGQRSNFYMEIPPLRLPKLSNVMIKTYSRMKWYTMEILPVFLLASVLIWLGQLSGVFDLIITGLRPVLGFVGLPPETAIVFLFGFFRRDYGAAGLYDLSSSGLITGNTVLVAAVVLTLFIPCIAQAAVMIKERGLKTSAVIMLITVLIAFGAGYVLNQLLELTGVAL